MNFQKAAADLGIETEEFLELVKLFVEKSISDLSAIEEAFSLGGTEQVAMAAHSIKGAAGNLGFQELYDVARTIELSARQKELEGGAERIRFIKEKINFLAELCR